MKAVINAIKPYLVSESHAGASYLGIILPKQFSIVLSFKVNPDLFAISLNPLVANNTRGKGFSVGTSIQIAQYMLAVQLVKEY